MNKKPQAIVFWALWLNLTAYYFYILIKSPVDYPWSFKYNDFTWHWVLTLSVLQTIGIVILRCISERLRDKHITLFWPYLAGIVLAHVHAQYAVFLVQPKIASTATLVWIIGLLGLILFFPAPLVKSKSTGQH
jgi:hypothetical protein